MKEKNKNITGLTVGAIATNCWLYPLSPESSGKLPSLPVGKRPCAVIDPGAEAGRITALLNQLGLYPVLILLTHGHFDHLAALPELVKAFGEAAPDQEVAPSALPSTPRIAIHRDDAPYLGPEAYSVHAESFTAASGNSWYVDRFWNPMPSPTVLLNGGDTIGPFTVLHLPGHTPGSIGFWDREEGVLFSGDTLFRRGVGRTDLPGGDWARLQESLRTLFTLDGDTAVYSGHGEETTIGEEAGTVF
jgi:glyoxylase-like metal-dependent hydrolase (beta-lactamase superfamily II)